MEISIQKKELLKGLERTLTIVERRNTMPALNHALLEAKDGTLHISATDLELFVTSSVPCKALTTGRIAVPARSLYDIVKELGDAENVRLRVSDGTRVEVISGKTNYRLVALAADSFPHFKTSPKGQLTSARVNCAEFVRLLQKTEHAVCTDEIRYFLTGIYLETHNDGKASYLRAVATDGHRLAMVDSPLSEIGPVELKKGLIIQKKGVTELRKLLETTTEDSFELTCDENLVKVALGDNHLWIRPIDGEYPDYKRVIPQSLPAQMKVAKRELLSGLRRMSHIVSDRSKVVTFDFRKDRLHLSTTNPELGEANDEVEVEYGGAEMKTGFNVRYFMDAMGQFDGEEIYVSLGEKLQPALLRCEENPGYLIVVMPMRI